jgi:hypothetical protein
MAETRPLDDDDDDYELELEPLDPEILAAEKARGDQRTESAVGRIDVDELYGETGQYSDLSFDLSGIKQFRFTTRHLLILTALLAIVLTLFRLFEETNAITVIAVVLLAGGWYWTSRLERKQQAERARRRAEFFGEADAIDEMADAALADAPPPMRVPFKFSFSMKELMITMTVAAVAVALFEWIGPEVVAMVFGLIALVGLVVNAAGVDPPRIVVLAWWLSLVIYIVVGFFQLARAAA